MVVAVNNNVGFEYLSGRGVEEKEVKEFQIGYCDTSLLIHSYNFPDEYCEYVTDKFRDSILIPMHSLYGDYVGILNRRLNPQKRNKCDSTSFDKSSHLFGLDKAYKYILEKDYVYLVEGPFDMIACWKYGYKNTVALLGTSLSFTQMCLLKRFTDKVYLALDCDKAGVTASIKYSQQLVNFGIVAYAFNLIKDPDEALRDDPNILKVF